MSQGIADPTGPTIFAARAGPVWREPLERAAQKNAGGLRDHAGLLCSLSSLCLRKPVFVIAMPLTRVSQPLLPVILWMSGALVSFSVMAISVRQLANHLVLMEIMAPGTFARLGFDWPRLHALKRAIESRLATSRTPEARDATS